jgi:nickel-type superoxide dismutase maturation protease
MRGRWWLAAAVGVGLVAVRATRPFRVEVAGSSMLPTLQPGDWLVATRARQLRRGDVVVLAHPSGGLDLVKRVHGVPGDLVDGHTLGPDQYLVVGDHSEASTDGRAFGPVARQAVEGVVRLRYWPRPRLL